jgi:hypothetical protein
MALLGARSLVVGDVAADRPRIPDTQAFVMVPSIHSSAARTFGAKARPLVISDTQKEGARRSAKGGCLTLLAVGGYATLGKRWVSDTPRWVS